MSALAWIQGMQEGASHGAAGAEGSPDVAGMLMHHILDTRELEFTILGRGFVIPLPQWEPIHFLGLTIDLSPTKHVVFVFLAAFLCLLLFVPLAAATRRKYTDQAPSGLANAVEALVLFFRDEVVRRNIGHGADAYTGYIITLFFFILFMNLLGLVPFGSTATSNFMVTGALAALTLILVEITGMRSLGFKGYLGTIFVVPKGMHPVGAALMTLILAPVELLGKIAKPFALMVRLFANMVAGHTLVLSLLGMIFLFAAVGPLRHGIAAVSVAMVLAISLLEVFVAFLQAYIFAMLTAVFVGLIRHAH
ncbi:MAG TPA: F0F1 ATP synthase subunit A [Longimicrobiales bacterium]|nr:F0F1 ATP synthase subunit A [Longimicrobiales bacterium]